MDEYSDIRAMKRAENSQRMQGAGTGDTASSRPQKELPALMERLERRVSEVGGMAERLMERLQPICSSPAVEVDKPRGQDRNYTTPFGSGLSELEERLSATCRLLARTLDQLELP